MLKILVNLFLNINNMGTQVTYAENLPEIPSEFIEPYAQRFLMMQVEAIGLGLITPDEARKSLNEVEHFISSFSGAHASYLNYKR